MTRYGKKCYSTTFVIYLFWKTVLFQHLARNYSKETFLCVFAVAEYHIITILYSQNLQQSDSHSILKDLWISTFFPMEVITVLTQLTMNPSYVVLHRLLLRTICILWQLKDYYWGFNMLFVGREKISWFWFFLLIFGRKCLRKRKKSFMVLQYNITLVYMLKNAELFLN